MNLAKAGDTAVLDLGDMEGTTHTFDHSIPDSALDQDDDLGTGDTDQLLGPGQGQPTLKTYSFWSMEFYQQFFDVDTDDVLRRLLWSILPRPGGSTSNFFKSKIRPKPDLYGPFWICVTLIFSMAISGNIASYLQSDTTFKWHYNFHTVSIVSSAVFGYAWVMPAILFVAVWWLSSKGPEGGSASGGVTFLELLCVYGYSLAIFIPLSVLWLIQIAAVQWILVVVGFALSGGVLGLSLWPDLTKKSPKFGTILILVVIGLHLLLACTFMLCFFHVPGQTVVKVESAKNETIKIGTDTNLTKDGENEHKAEQGKMKREGQNLDFSANKSTDETKSESPPEKETVSAAAEKVMKAKEESETDIQSQTNKSLESKN